MKLIGNIIWVLFGGLLLAIEYAILGLFWCITIIGIPFGIQLFKCASLSLWPFGREVRYKQQTTGCLSTGMNLIWILLGGLLLAIEHAIIGLVFCITIIGIPFGRQHFKLAAIALTPFGREIMSSKKIRRVAYSNKTESENSSETTDNELALPSDGQEVVTTESEIEENTLSTSDFSNLMSEIPADKQKMYIGGGIIGVIIVCIGLWLGLRSCSDSNVDVQLLQSQPVVWDKFVTPKSNQSTLYEQPDINHVYGKMGENDIAPVVDETAKFYKIYVGEGREAWVKKNQCKEVQKAPITQDLLSELLLNGQRLECRTQTFNGGNWNGLFLFFYRDFTGEGHLEVGILDDGRVIRPIKASIDAIALDGRGYELTIGGERPRLEYGTNYQLKDGSFEGHLDTHELSEKQVAEIWKIAQGNEPNKVLVSYYFPAMKAVRYYDVDLNVYGTSSSKVKYQTAEGSSSLSGFSYVVDGEYDSDAERTVYNLVAQTMSGEKISTETTDYAVELTIIAQGDYDGDGEKEAIVYEWGGGNSAQPPYLVYYDKDAEEFKKAEGFEDVYDNANINIEEMDGKSSIVSTVGLRKDRYVFENHCLTLAEQITPDVGERIVTIPLKQLFGDNGGDMDRSIYIDIDGDGETEHLTFHHDDSHALDWGKRMSLEKIEDSNWTIPMNADESLGVTAYTFTFLSSNNGGVPDILCDDAWIYRWDGSRYVIKE
jgi:uncharacterized membrane protein YccF (DUF307 family)